jgi:hypothetical protein
MPKRRKKHVAITRALVGTRLLLDKKPETIFVSADDIAPIVAALKASGLRIVKNTRRVRGKKSR